MNNSAANAPVGGAPPTGAQDAPAGNWLVQHFGRIARILVGIQLFGLLFCIAGTHGAFGQMPKPPTTTDFASFYTAGLLANFGHPGSAYDPVAHRTLEEAVIAPGVEEKRFLNPPVFLLVCAPLARLPYLAAFILFESVTAVIWLLLTTRIAGGGAKAATCLAAIPAVWWALGWGQNSFLSAGLMAGGTLLLQRRPMAGGALLGALCFKPHFGLLIPVALLAGRRWRAVLGAALSVVTLVTASTLVFGVDTWRAFLGMAAQARQTVETGIALAGHVDLAGVLRLAGVAASYGWIAQAGLSAAASCCVGWVWSRDAGRPQPAAANAVLVSATMAVMPFLLFYDLVMAGVAAAWLVRALRNTGRQQFSQETGWLAGCMLLSLMAFPLAAGCRLGVGVGVAPILLVLSVRLSSSGHRGKSRLDLQPSRQAAEY